MISGSAASDAVGGAVRAVRLPGWGGTVIAVAAAALVAASWLVFPYFVHGADLLRAAGESSHLLKAGQVSRHLSRSLVDHRELQLTATFATEDFFQFVDERTAQGLRPDRNLIFFVSETVHTGRLPEALPAVVLHVGEQTYTPAVSPAPARADHHRVTTYSFPKRSATNAGVDVASAESLRLDVSNTYLGSERPLTFLALWRSPYELPVELRAGARVPVLAVLALGAGLLSSVLTPCLLQMMLVFGSVTTGFATVPGPRAAVPFDAPGLVRRKLRLTAAAFVTGFTALYTAAGAFIGKMGQFSQLFFAEYRAALSLAAGAAVVALGVWMLLRGSRAVVCRVPQDRFERVTTLRDMAASALVAVGTALGCTVCFGGAIVGTLIVYVGTIGDPAIGAGVMFVFSLGFALPLLASAYSLSLSKGVLRAVVSHARRITWLSSAVVVAFGVVLMTDNFHVVSDLIYPYLGLR